MDIDHLRERWTISNGEEFRVWEYQREMLMLAAWAPIMVVTVPVLWVVFRRGRGKGAE